MLSKHDFAAINRGYDPSPARSLSLNAAACTDPKWLAIEREAIFFRSWQCVCHGEKVSEPNTFYVVDVQGRSLCIVRDDRGELRAFYNVCQYRAHELLKGEGRVKRIMCPYHAWTYDLSGQLRQAPHTWSPTDFHTDEICLEQVRVEEFCGFVYVNLDKDAAPLARQSGGLEDEIDAYDVRDVTLAHRLAFEIRSNWKNVIDNFLECYHCPVAHKDFCSLLGMDSYKVTTHGIYSSHMAKANKGSNAAYSTNGATVDDHAVWYLWPTTCLLRYPGRGNFIVLNVVPVDVDTTYETFDFYFETSQPTEEEWQAIAYLRDVLQREDIDSRGECATGHEDACLHPGPYRSRSARVRQERARDASFSRTGAEGVRAGCRVTGALNAPVFSRPGVSLRPEKRVPA